MFGINQNCQDRFVYDAFGSSEERYRQLTLDRLINKGEKKISQKKNL